MSTIQHGYFPRSAMDMEQWNRPMGSPQPWQQKSYNNGVKQYGQYDQHHHHHHNNDINTTNNSNIMTHQVGQNGTMQQNEQQHNNGINQQISTIDKMNQQMADQWKKQLNTLDMFDPFDALDHTIGRNMQWLNRPEFLMPQLPRVPQKYRVTLDCVGYKPSSIKTEWKNNVLTVIGREEVKEETGDFHIKEFKKTYTMPPHAECDKMVSFMTGDGQLVIEVPLKETEKHLNNDLFPQICDSENGGKCMKMKFTVPENIQPEHIHINIKDRCLVVKAEEKKVKPDGVSTFHYYKKTTLPENTDFDALKCSYDNHQISVQAPLNLDWTPTKKITWDNNKHCSTHDKQCHAIGDKCNFSGKQCETTWPKKA